MKYDEYLKNGYPIASGVIDGAQAMLDVRSMYLNEDWDEFTAYRIKKEMKRLYPARNYFKQIKWPLAA
jgi:hypothetical protein